MMMPIGIIFVVVCSASMIGLSTQDTCCKDISALNKPCTPGCTSAGNGNTGDQFCKHNWPGSGLFCNTDDGVNFHCGCYGGDAQCYCKGSADVNKACPTNAHSCGSAEGDAYCKSHYHGGIFRCGWDKTYHCGCF